MDIRDYLPPGGDAGTVARMEETGLGRILIHAFEVETVKRDKAYRRSPQINTTDVRQDIRHKLGEIDGLAFLSDLRQAALKASPGATA